MHTCTHACTPGMRSHVRACMACVHTRMQACVHASMRACMLCAYSMHAYVPQVSVMRGPGCRLTTEPRAGRTAAALLDAAIGSGDGSGGGPLLGSFGTDGTHGVAVTYGTDGSDESPVVSDGSTTGDSWLPPSSTLTPLWGSQGTGDRGGVGDSLVVADGLRVERGENVLLAGLEWHVRRGEHWLIAGHTSPLASRLSPLASHLSPLDSRLSPLASHLSPLTSHFSP